MPNGREEREGSALPPSYQRLSLKTSGSTTKCIDQYKKHQLKSRREDFSSMQDFVIRKSVEIERCFHKRHLTICVNNNCVSRFSNESGSLAEQAE